MPNVDWEKIDEFNRQEEQRIQDAQVEFYKRAGFVGPKKRCSTGCYEDYTQLDLCPTCGEPLVHV